MIVGDSSNGPVVRTGNLTQGDGKISSGKSKSLKNTAMKVACVATGGFMDFVDGFIRAESVQLGIAGLLFTATIVGAPIGIALMVLGFCGYTLSKHCISENVAKSCYEHVNVNPNHPLRWVPFLGGVGFSVIPLSFGGAGVATS